MHNSRAPPDYNHVRCSYDIWATALIMLDAVIPPWLIAFADKMSAYDATYGQECWPLLYQCIDLSFMNTFPECSAVKTRN